MALNIIPTMKSYDLTGFTVNLPIFDTTLYTMEPTMPFPSSIPTAATSDRSQLMDGEDPILLATPALISW